LTAGVGSGAGMAKARRQFVSSGSPYESVIGFSRAVVDGHHVHVSGTAPVMPDAADPPGDAYGQARRVLEIIAQALEEAGASLRDIVRTRTYLVRVEDWEDVGRAHGEAFADVRPASTMVVVAGFLDPRWLVEMEADALLPDSPEGIGSGPA
jgi:enamine deaminase RidA (YjgF/YER057c/UK114 family)